MRLLVFCLVLMLQQAQSLAQTVTPRTQMLLNSVMNRRATFVELQPIRKLYWSIDDTADLFVTRRGGPLGEGLISKRTLSEIIRNSASLDTIAWTRQELDSVVFVNNQERTINLQQEIKRRTTENAKQLSVYKKNIRRYNHTKPADRQVTLFSRPIFDNSLTYAVIEIDDGYLLSGHGAIVLYKWDESWHEVGVIKRWSY